MYYFTKTVLLWLVILVIVAVFAVGLVVVALFLVGLVDLAEANAAVLSWSHVVVSGSDPTKCLTLFL